MRARPAGSRFMIAGRIRPAREADRMEAQDFMTQRAIEREKRNREIAERYNSPLVIESDDVAIGRNEYEHTVLPRCLTCQEEFDSTRDLFMGRCQRCCEKRP
jgi:hypothetical protein